MAMNAKHNLRWLTMSVATAMLIGVAGCHDDRELRERDSTNAELEAREAPGNKDYYDSTRSVSEIDKPAAVGGPASSTDMDREGSAKTAPNPGQ